MDIQHHFLQCSTLHLRLNSPSSINSSACFSHCSHKVPQLFFIWLDIYSPCLPPPFFFVEMLICTTLVPTHLLEFNLHFLQKHLYHRCFYYMLLYSIYHSFQLLLICCERGSSINGESVSIFFIFYSWCLGQCLPHKSKLASICWIMSKRMNIRKLI